MEYFLGSLITLLIMAYFSKRTQQVMSKKLKSVQLSQSYIDSLVSQKILDVLLPPEKKKTQSTNHFKKDEVRVIVIEGEAYWIVNQTLYVANLVDGTVDNAQGARHIVNRIVNVFLQGLSTCCYRYRSRRDVEGIQ